MSKRKFYGSLRIYLNPKMPWFAREAAIIWIQRKLKELGLEIRKKGG